MDLRWFGTGLIVLACGGSGADGSPPGLIDDDEEDDATSIPNTGTGGTSDVTLNVTGGSDAATGGAGGAVILVCGDGTLDPDEGCDDNNSLPGDGCSGVCAVEPGYECPVVGEPCVPLVVCGDGEVGGVELCDDGNTESGDGCSEACDAELDSVCSGEPSECEEHGFTCAEQNIGNAVGLAVATGDTRLDDDDFNFVSSGGPDHLIVWTALEAGTYQFDLIGSIYDTYLGIFAGCGTSRLAYDDDGGGSWNHSRLTRSFAAGESVLIAVDGYNWNDWRESGPWQLDITLAPDEG